MAQILVIEDDLEMREMLKTMLEREGYDVLIAADGQEGFDVFSSEPTNLIITDILMPEKDGIDVIDYFHSNYPGVNIIAISGGGCVGPEDWLQLVKHMGVSYTFKKPFNRKELLKTVRELLPSRKRRIHLLKLL